MNTNTTLIEHLAASEVLPGDVLLYPSSSVHNIVYGSTVARVSEYDELTYVEDTDGFSVPYDMGEMVTVLRGRVVA